MSDRRALRHVLAIPLAGWLLFSAGAFAQTPAPKNAKPIEKGFGAGAYPFGSVAIPLAGCSEPGYTNEARAAHIQGSVVIEAVVNADGTLGDVRVAKSLDPALGLDLLALEAARKCKFEAGERGAGKKVASVLPLTMVFRLTEPGILPGEPGAQSEEDARFAGDAYSIRTPHITAPSATSQVEPKYPSAALRARVQGYVVLDVVVGADGTVRATRVVTSLDKELDRAAAEATMKWRFQPATLDSKPVAAVVSLQHAFRLY